MCLSSSAQVFAVWNGLFFIQQASLQFCEEQSQYYYEEEHHQQIHHNATKKEHTG
jgi:hypothetical protein